MARIPALLRSAATAEHRAMADTQLLERCLRVVGAHNLTGCVYPRNCIPLQVLSGVGAATERRLVLQHGISGAYDLASRCVALRATTPALLRQLLMQWYGVKRKHAATVAAALFALLPSVPSGRTGVVP